MPPKSAIVPSPPISFRSGPVLDLSEELSAQTQVVIVWSFARISCSPSSIFLLLLIFSHSLSALSLPPLLCLMLFVHPLLLSVVLSSVISPSCLSSSPLISLYSNFLLSAMSPFPLYLSLANCAFFFCFFFFVLSLLCYPSFLPLRLLC